MRFIVPRQQSQRTDTLKTDAVLHTEAVRPGLNRWLQYAVPGEDAPDGSDAEAC
jgi:hypothetical protein